MIDDKPLNPRQQAIARAIRSGRPLPLGTVLQDKNFKMFVSGVGWYDLDGNRSSTKKAGHQLEYEGFLVRKTKDTFEFIVTQTGEKSAHRMKPAQVHRVYAHRKLT